MKIGKHVIIDSLVNNEYKKNLNCLDCAYSYIEEISKKLNMTLVTPPILFRFPVSESDYIKILEAFLEGDQILKNTSLELLEIKEKLEKRKTDFGISGIGIWSTSHIAIHTWKEYNFISIDAYSCSDFNENQLIEFSKTYWNLTEGNTITIDRYINKIPKIKMKKI